jgi:hypothetical protein
MPRKPRASCRPRDGAGAGPRRTVWRRPAAMPAAAADAAPGSAPRHRERAPGAAAGRPQGADGAAQAPMTPPSVRLITSVADRGGVPL